MYVGSSVMKPKNSNPNVGGKNMKTIGKMIMLGFVAFAPAYVLISVLLAALSISVAHAEIEKIAIPSENGFSFYWWPKLPPIDGWHQDQEYSFFYSSNALAPDGFTFKNAETVMYARAIYKPRQPDVKSLEMLIANDKKDFLTNAPGIVIREVSPLVTADGLKLRSLTFFPAGSGNWERVSYGEEGEFYLVFTLSSRSESGFKAAVRTYEKLVSRYKK